MLKAALPCSAIALFWFLNGCAAQQLSERDCSNIQLRIDALGAAGGTVILGAGTWVCHSPIVIPSHVTLIGSGNTSLIRLADHANAPVIVIGSPDSAPSDTVSDVTVASLMVDGNRANQDIECWGGPCEAHPLRNNGITIRRAADIRVENVTIAGAASGGLVTELGCLRIRVKGLTAYDARFDGLAAYETESSSFSNLFLHHNGYAGMSFDIRFRNNTVSDAILDTNAKLGVFMRDSRGNLFSGLLVRGAGEHALFLAQVNDDTSTPAESNVFTGLVVENSKEAGIRINDASCKGNVLSGAVFRGNATCISQVVDGLLTTAAVTCQ